MAELVDSGVVQLIVDDKTLVLTSESRLEDVYYPKAPEGQWRMSWTFNADNGPFYSPVGDRTRVLETPPGHEVELAEVDQYCLMQIWPVQP